MAQLTKSLDDTLPEVTCGDISAGLNLQEGTLSLSPNQTFSCFNVIGFKGRTIYVGGFSEYTAGGVAAGADGNWQFYDTNNAKHLIEWRGGNMYDTVNGNLVTIATGCYIAGQNIGRIDQNGILYWTTASVPLQAFNGSTTTAVIDSGATGSLPIPAGTCLCSYAGSIIVGNPTILGVTYPGSFIASNVNDPTTFLASNQSNISSSNFIQALVPMGVASGGVPPTNSIMVVGSEFLILAQGAVNALKLNTVNVPMGCQDGNSVVYIPTGDLLGAVMYMGNDNQFWETNGITGDCVSKQLLNWLNLTIQTTKEANPVARFSGSYNGRYQYYIVDLGMNNQLVYRWQQKAWYYISGWPSGFYCEGTTGIGFPCNYVSSSSPTFTAAIYLVGQDNILFNGQVPVIQFNTPYLHGGDTSELKEYQWIYMEMNNLIPAAYNVYVQGLPFQGGLFPQSNTLLFPNPLLNKALLSNYGVWNVSLWDVALWGPGESVFPQQPAVTGGMLVEAVPATVWGPATTQPLRSAAATAIISWTNNGVVNAIPDFDVGKVSMPYKAMGHRMVGGSLYSAQQGASGSSYPFT
jgi:hypothetical protein